VRPGVRACVCVLVLVRGKGGIMDGLCSVCVCVCVSSSSSSSSSSSTTTGLYTYTHTHTWRINRRKKVLELKRLSEEMGLDRCLSPLVMNSCHIVLPKERRGERVRVGPRGGGCVEGGSC
jgi:hypothetical protein